METCCLFTMKDSWRVTVPCFIPGNCFLHIVLMHVLQSGACEGKATLGYITTLHPLCIFVILVCALERQGLNYSCSRKQGDKNPVWFTLGIREVLKGWDKGLQNMCTGERRKLTVPPSLAYGKEGKGKIPPNSALIFDIELMDIKNGPRSHESFREMDLNDDWKLSRNEVKEYIKKEFEKHGYFPNDTHHEVMVDDIFKNEDEDKDGFISAREFTYQHDEL
ncbi:peptidyl-prolyl cis-trans isomerase FKBP14 isoform X1 [Echeneis naucrates]|uniref:peptidyl-prolyl cis-trans isomerase FKBP14 isoform X1 n=1 Tax=Echeneis naucrates TaxID=173247 RepID=UPI001113C3B3|nr:peptidyl-prolyl cis-trans isomerase FKBP14-like isoform X1 [Echeneis naucrates]